MFKLFNYKLLHSFVTKRRICAEDRMTTHRCHFFFWGVRKFSSEMNSWPDPPYAWRQSGRYKSLHWKYLEIQQCNTQLAIFLTPNDSNCFASSQAQICIPRSSGVSFHIWPTCLTKPESFFMFFRWPPQVVSWSHSLTTRLAKTRRRQTSTRASVCCGMNHWRSWSTIESMTLGSLKLHKIALGL